MHLMIQPVLSYPILSNQVLNAQGFLARFLVAMPEPMAGTRTYSDENISNSKYYQTYCDTLSRILQMKMPTENTDPRVLRPRALVLKGEAKSLWIEVHNEIEAEMGNEGKYSSIKPFASKAAEQTLRLTGCLTLFKNINASEIDPDVLYGCARLINYYLSEIQRIYESNADPKILAAEKLLDWLRKQKLSYIYLGKIGQLGPSTLRSGNDARQAVTILEEHGYLVRYSGKVLLDGRNRKEVWAVNLEDM